MSLSESAEIALKPEITPKRQMMVSNDMEIDDQQSVFCGVFWMSKPYICHVNESWKRIQTIQHS